MTPKPLIPKAKCCESKPKCRRCPLRMLAEGTLPEGLAVRHRRVVTLDGKKVTKGQLKELKRAGKAKSAIR